jgi:hypothetical protein
MCGSECSQGLPRPSVVELLRNHLGKHARVSALAPSVNQKSTGLGLSWLVAYNSGSFGSPFSQTSSIERLGENP